MASLDKHSVRREIIGREIHSIKTSEKLQLIRVTGLSSRFDILFVCILYNMFDFAS